MNISCRNCGKSFDTNHSKKVFCSQSCKSIDYRKRKDIEEPLFLQRKQATKQKIEKKRVVMKKEVNPVYQNEENVINDWENHYKSLILQKDKLHSNYIKLLTANPVFEKTAFFSALGVFGGSQLTKSKKKKDNSLVNGFGLLSGLALGAIAYNKAKSEEYSETIERQNKINVLIDKMQRIDNEVNQTMSVINLQKHYLKNTEKYIEKEVEESYFEYVDLEEIKLPQLEKVAIRKKDNDSLVIGVTEFQKKEFQTYKLNENYFEVFKSNLPIPSSILIYGESGHGKSTWAIDFSIYLANNQGSTLYNSSEEGFGETLQRKFVGKESEYLTLSQCKDFETLKKVLQKRKYAFVIIDSVNDMAITPSQLKELRLVDEKQTIIYIMQATKGGDYKGSTIYKHDADYVIKIENFMPIREKGR